MQGRYFLTALWPGLSELWWRGRLTALPLAIAFTLAVNLLLVTRYIYPHWMAGGLVSMALWIGAITWVAYVIRELREIPKLVSPRSVSEEPDRFCEAQTAFLQGRWADAEKLLVGVLAIEPRDPPALLLLTGVYRQTDRRESAEILLGEIARLEAADGWWLEVQAERRRLRQGSASAGETSENKRAGQAAADLTEELPQAA